MTGTTKAKLFDLSIVRPDRLSRANSEAPGAGSGGLSAVLPAWSPTRALSNVVPFARVRRSEAEPAEVRVDGDRRPAPMRTAPARRLRLAALALVSLMLHGGLIAAFWQRPTPLASVGVQAISVELVLGANTAAGLSKTQGEQQVDAVAASDAEELEPKVKPTQEVQPTTQAPQNVKVAQVETAPEATRAVKHEIVKPDEAAPAAQQLIIEQATPADKPAPAHDPDAMPAKLTKPVESKLLEARPVDTQPVETAKPAETEVRPAKAADIKPNTVEAQTERELTPLPRRAPQRTRIAARTSERTREVRRQRASASSVAASGIGRGRSDLTTNYSGLVAAHLARHKRFPDEARRRGEQGRATISFRLDGSGRVAGVQLVRGSGSVSIDREAQAMVHRASPFPAPPSGRALTITVPINFDIR